MYLLGIMVLTIFSVVLLDRFVTSNNVFWSSKKSEQTKRRGSAVDWLTVASLHINQDYDIFFELHLSHAAFLSTMLLTTSSNGSVASASNKWAAAPCLSLWIPFLPCPFLYQFCFSLLSSISILCWACPSPYQFVFCPTPFCSNSLFTLSLFLSIPLCPCPFSYQLSFGSTPFSKNSSLILTLSLSVSFWTHPYLYCFHFGTLNFHMNKVLVPVLSLINSVCPHLFSYLLHFGPLISPSLSLWHHPFPYQFHFVLVPFSVTSILVPNLHFGTAPSPSILISPHPFINTVLAMLLSLSIQF